MSKATGTLLAGFVPPLLMPIPAVSISPDNDRTTYWRSGSTPKGKVCASYGANQQERAMQKNEELEKADKLHRQRFEAAPADNSGVGIRVFALEDYEQASELWQAVGFRGWSLLTRGQVVKKLRRDPDLFLVADLEGQVIGTVIGSWDGYRGWAHNVAVHPSHQRQGIGRILMCELEKRLWRKGARVLNLHYFNDSTGARDFYHSLGFQDATNATTTQKVLKEPGEET